MKTQALQKNTEPAVHRHNLTPRVDIWESDDALNLEAEMPGVGTGDVDVQLEEGVLTISGHTQSDDHRQRTFQRVFRVSEVINSENISATMRNGMLSVTLPKADAVKPRRIAVNAA